MDEHTRKGGRPHEGRPGALGVLIHEPVRRVIEVAVEEELTAALGATRYARAVARGGYRNGHRPRTLTGVNGHPKFPRCRAACSSRRGAPGNGLGTGAPVPAPVARGE
jgi:hypothetical protein